MATKSNAKFVARGYGQVEPNHLSAPRSGRVYAQLPAAPTYDFLEQGQFVKYDYAKKVCDTTGAGAWMMVYNEVKLYRDFQTVSDFALIKDDYAAGIYSPAGGGNAKIALTDIGKGYWDGETYNWIIEAGGEAIKMPEDTTMVPRVLFIEVGDIYTTNTINAEDAALAEEGLLIIGTGGYLEPVAAIGDHGGDLDPVFQIVKKYTMPDGQPGCKVQRIA